VIDAIRGKRVDEALAILRFTPNYAARLIEKVVRSAAANAENNHHMDGDNLKIVEAMVDGGPMMKRVRYAPMGRGYRMVKRLSHITVGVEETEPLPEKKSKRKETGRGRRWAGRTAKPTSEAPAARTAPKGKAAVKETRAEPEKETAEEVLTPAEPRKPETQAEAVAEHEVVEEPRVEAVAEEPQEQQPSVESEPEVDESEDETQAKGGE
jgi:large subunit ribosomal protein L22